MKDAKPFVLKADCSFDIPWAAAALPISCLVEKISVFMILPFELIDRVLSKVMRFQRK
jgi:hypothetical protein